MSSAFDLLSAALDDKAIGALGSQIGADKKTVENALAGALPMLLSGLAKNSRQSSGAASLATALDRDHDGSILDDIGSFLGGGKAAATGAGILPHVLGGRQGTAEEAVSRMSGLDAASAAKLLAMVAPLALGVLGKAKRQRNLDAGGLADLLGQEHRRVEQEQPQAMSVLGGLLDQDGDGQVGDDVANLGASLLSSFLRR